MPRNTAAGVVVAAFGTLLCFALVWHVWSLAIASLIGVLATFIARTYDRDIDWWVPAAEVERIESARHAALAEVA
jgi:cytochrome o ubiquinol oxidase subunit 1